MTGPEIEPAVVTEQAATHGWSDPRLPWTGKPRTIEIVCWASIVLVGIYSFAILPFRASLVGTHPLILILLNGSTEGIISAAASVRVGHGSLAVVLLAAVPGLMKFDLIYWWAGRLWGDRILVLLTGGSKRGKRYLQRVHTLGRGFTWPAMLLSSFLPIPHVLIYASVGMVGMRAVTFLFLDAISSLAWAGMLAGLGYAIGQPAVNVAKQISHYGLWISIGLVVIVVFFQVRSQRRMFADLRAQGAPQADAPGDAEAAADGVAPGASHGVAPGASHGAAPGASHGAAPGASGQEQPNPAE